VRRSPAPKKKRNNNNSPVVAAVVAGQEKDSMLCTAKVNIPLGDTTKGGTTTGKEIEERA
jgi:hypothetical protein